jgi:hypothetical protein
MDVIVIRDGLQSIFALALKQDFIRNRAAERADASAAKIRKPADAAGVRITDREHLAERVIRNRCRRRRATSRRVFHAAQTDLRGSAFDSLIDRAIWDEEEMRCPLQSTRDEFRNLNVEPGELVRIGGIRLNERSTTLKVTGPQELGLLSVHVDRKQGRER